MHFSSNLNIFTRRLGRLIAKGFQKLWHAKFPLCWLWTWGLLYNLESKSSNRGINLKNTLSTLPLSLGGNFIQGLKLGMLSFHSCSNYGTQRSKEVGVLKSLYIGKLKGRSHKVKGGIFYGGVDPSGILSELSTYSSFGLERVL